LNTLATVTSLLLSTALLLVGHGMQLTLLPLRAVDNGMSETLIGVTASSYFIGFVVGCLFISKMIAKVGHIRCFTVLAASAASVVLCLEMVDHWIPWLVLRFITGFAMSGLYASIESWLNSHTTSGDRGRVLSVYTFITLSAMAAGQVLINVGTVESSTPFSLAAMFLILAIVPIGLTSKTAPVQVGSTSVAFRLLYQRSHSAFAGALLSGLVTGSFWSMGAVFFSHYSESQVDITWYMSAALLGGALLQYPIGWLSDYFDRRRVLILLCVGGTLSSVAVSSSTEETWHLAMIFWFGAMVMPIYAISLATAADVSRDGEFVVIGTTVLILNAIGAAAAPMPLGQLMAMFGPPALFLAFAAMCALFAVLFFALSQTPRDVTVEEQIPFTVAASAVAPASFELDDRISETDSHTDLATDN
jgi:MFS family permease